MIILNENLIGMQEDPEYVGYMMEDVEQSKALHELVQRSQKDFEEGRFENGKDLLKRRRENESNLFKRWK